MEEKKEAITEMIQQINDEKAIDYLLDYIKAFIKFYNLDNK